MVLGSVTIVVNFQEPQNYFGGQVVLTNTDGSISFTTTQDELRALAIAKAKSITSASELLVISATYSVANSASAASSATSEAPVVSQ